MWRPGPWHLLGFALILTGVGLSVGHWPDRDVAMLAGLLMLGAGIALTAYSRAVQGRGPSRPFP